MSTSVVAPEVSSADVSAREANDIDTRDARRRSSGRLSLSAGGGRGARNRVHPAESADPGSSAPAEPVGPNASSEQTGSDNHGQADSSSFGSSSGHDGAGHEPGSEDRPPGTNAVHTPPRQERGLNSDMKVSPLPRDSPATVTSIRSQGSRRGQPNFGCCGNQRHHHLVKHFRLLRDSSWFQTAIILVIFVAGIQVGIGTYPVDPESQLQAVLDVTDQIVMAIFIMEIVIKVIAEGNMPWLFFSDSWNCFDFAIVAVGLMPIGGGSAVTALRLIRLLRVLKLVRALPKLRLLVMGLLQSMSSIAYIGLLLGMLFYLYAVVGVSMFGVNDPVHMGTLHITLLTLFRCATLEDWSDIMYIATTGCEHWGYEGIENQCVASQPKPFMGVLYFASFVVLANMMILNLFIGVITTSMAEAKQTLEEEMVVEEQERQRQKRILLGLPSESEAEDGGLDDAIGVTIDRIQYLLRKCETKSSKFETTFKAVVRELDMPNSSSRREQILARSLSEPAIAAKHAHNVPSRRAVGSGTPAAPPVQARIRPSVSTVAQSLNTTGNTDGADASVAAITGMQAVSGDSNNVSSRSLPERTRSKRGHRPVGESVSIEPVRVVSLQQLRQAMP